MTLDPVNDLPEVFKGVTRGNGGDFYCYNVNHFAYINVTYHQPGPSDGKPIIGPGMLDPTAPFYEVYLTYDRCKNLTVFCYSKKEVAEALERCWVELGFQIRLQLMAAKDRLVMYEQIDLNHDERGFWQRLDKT